jgi:transposase
VLNFPPSIRVFLCLIPTDMRRSFDALAMMAEHVVRQDPFSGHLFVFVNRFGDRLKLLYWDRDGYAIWYKRLEEGTFQVPRVKGEGGVEIPMSDLMLMLQGVDLASAKKRKRYSRPER